MTDTEKITLTTAAQGAALTQPAPGTTEGRRTKKLIQEVNSTVHESDAFKKLQELAFKEGWSREKFAEEAQKLGAL